MGSDIGSNIISTTLLGGRRVYDGSHGLWAIEQTGFMTILRFVYIFYDLSELVRGARETLLCSIGPAYVSTEKAIIFYWQLVVIIWCI